MFYSQQTITDCGITGIENLLQLPRSVLPPIKYYLHKNGEKYASYAWKAETLNGYGKFKFDLGAKECPIPLLNEISLLGVQFYKRPTWHCVYQYYDKFWCGHEKDFININFIFDGLLYEKNLYEKNDAVIRYKITRSCVEDLKWLYYLHDAIKSKKEYIVEEI